MVSKTIEVETPSTVGSVFIIVKNFLYILVEQWKNDVWNDANWNVERWECGTSNIAAILFMDNGATISDLWIFFNLFGYLRHISHRRSLWNVVRRNTSRVYYGFGL